MSSFDASSLAPSPYIHSMSRDRSPSPDSLPIGSNFSELGSAPPQEPDLCTCNGLTHECWDVDLEVFGVMHNSDLGCMICNRFASHIHRSREQGLQGIEEAFAKMHRRHDCMWRKGLEEGKCRMFTSEEKAYEELDKVQIEAAKVEEELKYLTDVVLGKIGMEDFLSMFVQPTYATREEFQGKIESGNTRLWNDTPYESEWLTTSRFGPWVESVSSPGPNPNGDTLTSVFSLVGSFSPETRCSDTTFNLPGLALRTPSPGISSQNPRTPPPTPSRSGDDIPNHRRD
jgi:hypothetical protein